MGRGLHLFYLWDPIVLWILPLGAAVPSKPTPGPQMGQPRPQGGGGPIITHIQEGMGSNNPGPTQDRRPEHLTYKEMRSNTQGGGRFGTTTKYKGLGPRPDRKGGAGPAHLTSTSLKGPEVRSLRGPQVNFIKGNITGAAGWPKRGPRARHMH